MPSLRPALPLLALLGSIAAFGADPEMVSPEAYAREVDLIDRLFLYQDDLTAGRLLQAAAAGLSDELHWLVIEPEGDNGVFLRHGNNTVIGEVSVASMDTLPQAMLSLESLVRDSGFPLGDVDVRLELLKGATAALDRYSRVLSGEKLDRFDVRLKGTLVGVGATLERKNGELIVTSVVKDGPAERGGLRIGDVLLRLDGIATTNMQVKDATERIKGEIDSPVMLTVRRGATEQLELVLVRAEIVVPNVDSRVLPENVAYLHIDHFSQKTVDNLLGELARLGEAGALSRGLIIDLRGNTGGSMKEAGKSADQFLTKGLLLRTEGPDGQEVQNLQARMDAVAAGDELPLPIVVLIDNDTASGSEILAGALFELDRAVLIGYPSYGKGTVQKLYNLDDGVRFKLTVAQYVLANDRKIAEGGLIPDAVLGRIDLEGTGAHYRGWEESHAKVPWESVVPVVYEPGPDGRLRSGPKDFGLELARRTVLRAETPCLSGMQPAESCATRAATLAALGSVLPEMRAEQEALLVKAYLARGINWNAGEAPPVREGASPVERPVPQATAKLVLTPDPVKPEQVDVSVEVHNEGPDPLYRLLVELECDTFEPWSGLVIPIGEVDANGVRKGKVRITLPLGIEAREDSVRIKLRAEHHAPLALSDTILQVSSPQMPRLAARAVLSGTGIDRVATVTLENPGATPLDGVDVQFAWPGDLDVELMDTTVPLASIPAKGEAVVTMHLRVGPLAPAVLPLELEVRSPLGRLADWPLALPADGTAVRVEPPKIVGKSLPLSAPVGSLTLAFTATDDVALDHVVVFANGEKIAWAAGAAGKVDLRATTTIDPGINRWLVVAEDNQGLVTRRLVIVRGESATSVDAAP